MIEYESFLNTIEDELYCSLVQIGGKIPLQYFEAFAVQKGCKHKKLGFDRVCQNHHINKAKTLYILIFVLDTYI